MARLASRVLCISSAFALCGLFNTAIAQETVCARVKIEIKQELTLERQAFDAQMKINNTTDTGVIENVSVVVKVTDENGTPVEVSDSSTNQTAKFFIRLSSKENIAAVDGSGAVNPKTTATINWLLIPAPGSAGINPAGKKYLVGATLKYKFGGEESTLDVSPDVITVKPLPLLTLDYFLTQDVFADDPLTETIEPIEPFTLGVRVKNNGYATAKSLKIDSAQPKIIENNQGLLINFKLDGSYVNDAPVQNTLLIDFGDIAPSTAKMGRWLMETTLSGTFTEFTARFSHADELGGSLTSLLQATNAHFLIRDVRVDLPGRDLVKDFLAKDGDVIRVYESDSTDTEVLDRSSQATLVATSSSDGKAVYQLTVPPTAGFFYARVADPFGGQKALGQITRSDAKSMLAENVWLSKTKNATTKQWEYWVNFFDVNTTGSYRTEFNAPAATPLPPVIQFIPDYTVDEGKQVSFLVEASSQNGRAVTLTAVPLPAGATFQQQATDPQSPAVGRAIFDWTPGSNTAGNYLIVYTATDGLLSSTRSAAVRVNSNAPPPGPGVPAIQLPGVGAQVATLMPTLVVQTSSNAQDPTKQVQFEVYGDQAMTQLVESNFVTKGVTTGDAGTTSYTIVTQLNDNQTYWWRARAYDGTQVYSDWINGHFFVNLFNDAPESFNLASPAPSAEVVSVLPTLAWSNTTDKEGDAISYSVYVYSDTALTTVVASALGLAPADGSMTSWTLTTPLTNHTTYYWKVIAQDSHGAQTASLARLFIVNTGNTAPTLPVIVSPAIAGQSSTSTLPLTVQNSTDAENDVVTYIFELDTVSTFDSGQKRTSGEIIQTSSTTTSWTIDQLVENQRYWWRVKARDGRAESVWVVGDFLMNSVNEAPVAPTIRNPSNGSWSATQQPTLEANPATDPEEDAVHYDFEIYKGTSLTTLVTSGTSDQTAWTLPQPLTDKSTYNWRVRAVDVLGATSAWSAPAVLYVSTGTYQDPSIQMTAPAAVISPTVNGIQKTVTISWTGTDNNIEPTIALYYSETNTGYVGNLIVDGIRQASGTQSGSYVWDVSSLSPGAYYIYGMIYDSRGIGRAYAAGTVVVPNPTQSGGIVVTGNNLVTAESSGTNSTLQATFKVRLSTQPAANVTVPLNSSNVHEGAVTSLLTFTPQDWGTDKTATITGVRDCVPDGVQKYQILVGPAVSLDPNYIGLNGSAVNVSNVALNASGSTNNTNLHICRFAVTSKKKINVLTWEYTLTGELTNTGTPVSKVTAVLSTVPSGITMVEKTLSFGAAATGETVKSTDTFTIRSILPYDQLISLLGMTFKWNVTVQ